MNSLDQERLNAFEKMLEDIILQQEAIPLELEELRLAGKTKTLRFRELVSRKLMNEEILCLFNKYNLIKEKDALASFLIVNGAIKDFSNIFQV
ncbi:MAG: hypothetical protein RR788_06130 [Erysipelotrichaceae bacterium]